MISLGIAAALIPAGMVVFVVAFMVAGDDTGAFAPQRSFVVYLMLITGIMMAAGGAIYLIGRAIAWLLSQ